MPLIDSSIMNLPQNKTRKLLLSLGGVFCVLSAFRCSSDDILGIGYGYSLTWLCMLYLFGAYLRKYRCISRYRLRYFIIGYIVSISFLMLGHVILKRLGIFVLVQYFCSYTSLPALTSAICVFGICLRVHLPIMLQKIILCISPYAFGVYLIHVHPLVFKHFFEINPTNPMLNLYSRGGGITAFFMAIGIFSLGILIDSIRGLLFRFIKIQNHLHAIDKWYE